MLEELLALGFLAAYVLLGAVAAAALHVILRPKTAPHARASGALRELEPRGGRHRFHVRLYEVVALAAAWITALGVLSLWAPVSDELSSTGDAAAGAAVVALLASTWWAWRRGALRARPSPAPATDAVEGADA